ncbi:PREDICTED: sushi, von Willebrand factor type A, EGF and pentraxin domain-containing protein 1-like [Branchiostoma belcheri]|uniref:Sushi, von Willebrand factor type A, EGF and pentraxin domain-containing protein 1-like n=1 Tax=Branchiostoma belcheri TaxID=7741 RepID=A0A6P5A3L3_BRABE|nr:PREDICTED: sushi, von Willebrand factor type A, EGF and pentraxin domain-containing protein 1-like [Branchiostoma belcheri]
MATPLAGQIVLFTGVAAFIILQASARNSAQQASSFQNQVKKYQDSRADIVFLLDSSGSVGEHNFQTEITFVENFLSQLTISPHASRVAVVSFDDVARTHIDYIRSPKNKCSFLRELKTVKYTGGSTNADDAFRLAQELLRPRSAFTHEAPVKQVVVYLTDGKPDNDKNPVGRANNLKSVYNAEIYSIGVGDSPNKQQLHECATDASHVYLSSDFVDAKDLTKRIRGDSYSKRYETNGVTSADCSSPGCGANSECACGSATGEYECACKPGYYGTGRGAPCTPCPKGRYKELLAPSVSGCPGTCPAKSSTKGTASTSPNQCVCNEGHEGNPWGSGCKPVRCDPRLEAPDGGTVQPANCNNEYLTTCQFQCNYGYKMLSGTPERTCHANKTWSGAPVICQRIECQGLPEPSDGQRACVTSDGQQATGTYPYETTCTFTCNKGYTLQGSKVRRCLQEGKWDGSKAKCLVKKCDALPMVVNATVSPSSCVSEAQKFDTACQFTCQDGYRMDGTANRVCQEDGSWSNRQPSCIDDQSPRLVIGCPADIVNSTEQGQNYLTVDWTVPAAVDNSGKTPKMTVTPAGIKPPHKFPITTGLPTVVTYTFTDDSGMASSCGFEVNVLDTEKPKLIEHCVNYKVETNDETVKVDWTEPVFTDNSKQPVRVNCDKDSGQRFYWGTAWVTCTARDSHDNSAECRFSVTVSPTSCPHQDPPINGALSCDDFQSGQFCTVQCDQRFDFHTEPARMYICGSGNWRTDPHGMDTKWPDCSLKRIPGFSKGIEFQYYLGDCEDEETQKYIKQNFIDLFNSTVFGRYGGCVGNVKCRVENVALSCSEEEVEVPEEGAGLDGPSRRRRSLKERARLLTIRLDIKTQYKNSKSIQGGTKEVKKKIGELKEILNGVVEKAKQDVRTGQLSDMAVTAGEGRRSQLVSVARVSGPTGEDVGIIDLDTDAVLSCDRGQILKEDFCVDCPVGTYYTDVSGEATCDVCPLGSYQDEEGQTECIQCEPGFFTAGNNSKNATDCRGQCPPGAYSETGLETCMFCPKGTYQNQEGATECIACEEGTTTGEVGTVDKDDCSGPCVPGSFSRTGTDPCALCPVGTFQPGHGQTECLSCPLGTGTDAVGSEASSDCVELDYCQSFPCQNGGSCSMQGSEFNCQCPAGFEGDMCDVNVDECAAMPCYSLATCLDRVNGYECVCASGWAGERCDVNIDECAPAPCLNGATCVDEDNGFLCLCADGYSGTFCEVNIDDCSDSPCNDTAVCVDLVDSFQCLCQDGYTGKYCEVDINDCEAEPCQNGGMCTDEVGRYTCQCKPGFVGYNCELNVNECASNPCLNRAHCEDKINSYQCHCAPGFGGTHCKDELSSDFDLKFPKGILSEFTSAKIEPDLSAVTVAFWMKMDLDKKDQKYIFSYATENDGVVQDNALVIEVDNFNEFLFMVNGEKITTTASVEEEAWHHYAFTWAGGSEQQWAFYVDGERNTGGSEAGGGRLIPGGGTIVLGQDQDEILGGFDSTESFKGKLSRLNVWDHVLTEDQISVMARHCTDDSGNVRAWPDFRAAAEGLEVRQGSAFCAGKPSLVGVNECESNPCQNGGSCVDHINTFTCLCTRGYTGINCEKDLNKCGPNNAPCDHTCHDTDSGFKCSCYTGFKRFNDIYCIEEDECVTRNGGCDHNCINTPGSHLCSCYPGYVLGADQKSCVDVNECAGIELRDGQQLENGGCTHTCVNLEGGYECTCPTGLVLSEDGRSCQDIDECETGAADCSHLCINTLGSFQCACHPGYSLLPDGKMCQAGGGGPRTVRACEHSGVPVSLHCSSGTIHITAALYGRKQHGLCSGPVYTTDCESSTSLSTVKSKCDGHSTCSVQASNSLFGDPCQGTVKYLEVTYQCDRSCSRLPEVEHGTFEVSSSDSTVGRVVCNDGYRVLGNPVLRCDMTGHWGGALPRCIVLDCGKPKQLKNGARLGSGHSVKYYCNKGYLMVAGDGVRACQSNGVWSGEHPVCKKDPCLPSPCARGKCTRVNVNLGTFNCSCPRGWTGKTCDEDINECHEGPCGPRPNGCQNAPGSFTCLCAHGYEPRGKTCVDVDECRGHHDCAHICQNTQGGYRCECYEDFTIDSDGTSCYGEWPRGTYGLPKTDTGCPEPAGVTWRTGVRVQDTEDDDSNNRWSPGLHFDGNFWKNNVHQKFCMKTSSWEGYGNWPSGSYCIFKKGGCPSGFQRGELFWDDEDTIINNKNSRSGELPDGKYDHNTLIRYCCRNDGNADTPAPLPHHNPFYLFRYKQGCQKVAGMNVREEYFHWDDEDDDNANRRQGAHPYDDGDSRNHKLHYCYYW